MDYNGWLSSQVVLSWLTQFCQLYSQAEEHGVRAVRVQDEQQGELGQAHGEAPQQYRGQYSIEAEMQQVQDNLSLGRGIQVANHDLKIS